MDEKLLTLKEASEYLGIPESRIKEMVDKGQMAAYKLGGSLLRFRISQLEGVRFKISEAQEDADRRREADEYSFSDRVKDFFYFNDFYIASSIIILLVLVILFKSR